MSEIKTPGAGVPTYERLGVSVDMLAMSGGLLISWTPLVVSIDCGEGRTFL
jgi:hypothetical protein